MYYGYSEEYPSGRFDHVSIIRIDNNNDRQPTKEFGVYEKIEDEYISFLSHFFLLAVFFFTIRTNVLK